MIEQPQFEHEPKEPFDRAKCIRSTVTTYSPSLFPLGGSIEERYLDDTYTNPDRPYVQRNRGVEETISAYITQLEDPGTALTDEKLKDLSEQERQVRRAWGVDMVARARELGLVKSLTSRQAGKHLPIRKGLPLDKDIDSEYGVFSYSGWEIFGSKDDVPMLVVPTKTKGKVRFDVLNIEDLHQQDPQFVQSKIREYQEAYALHGLANSVTYNLGLHGVSVAELLPEFMQELDKLTVPGQKSRETHAIYTFLSLLVSLGDDFPNYAYHFVQGLSSRASKLPGENDGRNAYINSYFEHMASCDTQPSDVQRRSEEMRRIYDYVLAVDVNDPRLTLDEQNRSSRLLKRPWQYAKDRLQQAETENNEY